MEREKENLDLTITEENLLLELLACNESITFDNLPPALPAVTNVFPSYSPDTLKYLIATSDSYILNPFYLDDKNSEIKPKMIMILIDWMMEVCTDFHFHRDTFHQSISYVHQYLLLKNDIVNKGY